MNKLLITGIIIVLVIVGIFAFGNLKSTGKAVDSNVKEFNLDATRFVYEPDTIVVSKGDKVRININNIDTLHGIRIPDFNVKDNNQVEFIADKSGEFPFYCTVFCGDKHKEMKGKLIIK